MAPPITASALARLTRLPLGRPWLRFSLRTMFVLMTIGGVVLAPLSYELYRARIVAEQARVITEMNGQYALARRRNSYSAWLAERLWPGRSEFLALDVDGAFFYKQPCELTPLARVPGLRRLALGEPVTVGEEAFSHLGVRTLRLSPGGKQVTSDSFVSSRILSRFPLVEEVDLNRIVPSQALIDDLATCGRVQRLTINFVQPYVPGRRTEMTLVDFAPLRQLDNLRQLRINSVAHSTDWSFLAELKQLEEVQLCPLGTYSLGGTEESWIKNHGPIPPPEQSPLHYLCELRALKKVELYGSPAYRADIERLVTNARIEELRLDVLPDGLDSLRPLQKAKSLRKLYVSISYFGDHAGAARTLLESLQIEILSLGHPYDNAR